MEASGIPVKFALVWAVDAAGSYITSPIPTATQTGPNINRASLQIGFPPGTFTDPAAGGAWPDGRDFQGALNMLSAWNQWTQAGAPVSYDSAFSTAIGGYPQGAVLQSSVTQALFWLSTADNNTSDPDTGGSNWIPLFQTFNFLTVDFSATTTWTVLRTCWHLIRGQAGGGGGGSGNGTFGGSGGGGGFTLEGSVFLTAGQVLDLTIGAGGLGSDISGNAGLDGGHTICAISGGVTLFNVNPGGGGQTGGGNGGNPGNSFVNDASFIVSEKLSGQGGFVSAPFGESGAPGGACQLGGFGGQQGNSGSTPGGGGAGNNFQSTTPAVDCNGAPGLIKITYPVA